MSTVKVKQVVRRYHLKPSERDLQPHLNGLTETVLRNQLESVLFEAGIGSSELVCIKELHLAMYYDNNKSDFEICQLWRKVLFKSVYSQLGSANRVDLIRYPSIIEAIKSVARSLSVGQVSHQWAWQQLGITDGKSADFHQVKDQWIAYLKTHPYLLLPVIKGLMTEGTFIKLLERKVLASHELIQLTDIATKFLHLEINWSEIVDQQKEQGMEFKKVDLLARKILASELIMALLRTFQSTSKLNFWSAQLEPSTSIQTESKTAFVKLLFWAVMEPTSNELNLASSTKEAIEANLSLLWKSLSTEPPSHDTNKKAEFSTADNIHLPQQKTLSAELIDKGDKEFYSDDELISGNPKNGNSLSTEPPSHDTNKKAEFSTADNIHLPQQKTLSAELIDKGDKEFYSDDELISGNPLNKQSLFTQFGGLLFLLNKLDQEKVLQHLQHKQLAQHSLSWLLENFCWLLLPECKGDEAVNVFSGRVFDKHQDEEFSEVICDDEEQLLTEIAQEFKQKINSSLVLFSHQKHSRNNDLFANMCRRKARIEAQPGWVNVFYELDSVDTTVRAAGLDLNPEYLPWLAYVVKFYYE